MASPRAMRLVRMETSLLVQDVDEDLKELPTSTAVRRLFVKWIQSRGYNASLKVRVPFFWSGHGDDDGEPMPYCHLDTFQRFWEENYPNLVLPNPREGICTPCWIFANACHHFAQFSGSSECSLMNGFDKREAAVKQAEIHVAQTAAQRKLFNALADE